MSIPTEEFSQFQGTGTVTSDDAFLSYLGGNQNNLSNVLSTNENNDENHELQVIQCSSYYDIDKFTILANSNTNSFSILSSNIQSINAKFNELEMFVEDLLSINFNFSVICLQETWKADNDDFSKKKFDGYDCITQGKKCSNKGGLLIYVDNKYKSEVKMNLNTYEHWEGLMIKVTGNNLSKTMTIGNIYRPPRTCNENITNISTLLLILSSKSLVYTLTMIKVLILILVVHNSKLISSLKPPHLTEDMLSSVS